MTFPSVRINGKSRYDFPIGFGIRARRVSGYLKKHTEALVKDVGIEAACALTGKSKATLGRYYSDNPEHGDRYMPIDTVTQLEAAASFPHVTGALADLKGITLSYGSRGENQARKGGINQDVITLSQRFAMLMAEYNQSIEDGKISVNEAKRLLRDGGFAADLD
mgnify:FL=1